MANIHGTNGDDILNGTTGNDLIKGLKGNDTLNGKGGKDTLCGGFGDDTLDASSSKGNNILNGGSGDDRLNVSSSTGNNTVKGGNGNDSLDISSSTGNNTVKGGSGDDDFYANSVQGTNTLNGGNGNDSFHIGTPSSLETQTIDGGKGNDSLDSSSSNTSAPITTTFDATTNIGSITNGTNQVSYKNIESLNITGTAYDDLIVGSNGDDILLPGIGGNDTIIGGAGNDRFSASMFSLGRVIERNEVLGNKLFDGGDGVDDLEVNYYYTKAGITTTFDATTNIGSITNGTSQVSYKNIEQLSIFGTDKDDYIVGSNGDDTLLTGRAGNDTIIGGAGNDYLRGESKGNKLLDGGDGDDSLNVSYSYAEVAITTTFDATTNTGSIISGRNQISYKNIERLNITGTDKDDYIVGSNGDDTLSGGDVDDYTFMVFGGNDTLIGGGGNDTLIVYLKGNKLLDGGDGNDSLVYYGAVITTSFDATTNTGSITNGTNQVSYKNIEQLDITGSDKDDYIVGNNGNDSLSGGNGGDDTIIGGAGNDTLTGFFSGNKLLDGGDGNDSLQLYYSDSSTGLTTTFEATTNTGSITDSTNQISYKNIEQLDIRGSDKDDYIVGSNGNDTINGGYGGNDALYGKGGTDTFDFGSYDIGVDNLYDFDATNELIQVSADGFGGSLVAGSLKTSQFTLGTTATTSAQRFIYDNTTGALYFDADGSAAGFTQVQFAQINNKASLTNNNFVVIPNISFV